MGVVTHDHVPYARACVQVAQLDHVDVYTMIGWPWDFFV